jgi:hypothetical protein
VTCIFIACKYEEINPLRLKVSDLIKDSPSKSCSLQSFNWINKRTGGWNPIYNKLQNNRTDSQRQCSTDNSADKTCAQRLHWVLFQQSCYSTLQNGHHGNRFDQVLQQTRTSTKSYLDRFYYD